ncbi:MAG: Phosphoenolpyruvate-protein phosphotransferase [Firmicutes bacterium ADurb.Bin506]|nr:MAG: Phosphoenolpyruvate-protein phosphotransferase [Firmicutes bacterium ADurb.Bin506]
MACDRGNSSVGYLNDPFHPAVLTLIHHTIEKGHENSIWVGMCGEMAGHPLAIPLLVGMGIDELSMASSSVPRAKQIVRSVNSRSAADIWSRVRKLSDAEQVRAYLESVR